jgi:hypothetical protein
MENFSKIVKILAALIFIIVMINLIYNYVLNQTQPTNFELLTIMLLSFNLYSND